MRSDFFSLSSANYRPPQSACILIGPHAPSAKTKAILHNHLNYFPKRKIIMIM